MRFTYVSAANNTTNGQALLSADEAAGASTGRDVYVKKLLVGNPVAAGTVILYNKTTAFSGDTSNIAFKLTEPTASAGSNLVGEVDFTTNNGKGGLQLDGGNVMVTGSVTDVTVVWCPVDEDIAG